MRRRVYTRPVRSCRRSSHGDALPKNPVAEQMLRLLYARARLLPEMASAPGWLQQMADELSEMVRAIERRDPDAADAAAREHVLHVGRMATSLLRDEIPTAP